MAAPPDLTLVGVVHGDPAGYEKLTRLLEQVQPRLISVEISVFSVHYRLRYAALWRGRLNQGLDRLPPSLRGHLALRGVAAHIALPFEVRAAADYARRRGVAWRAVDSGRLAREYLPKISEELLSPENLWALTAAPDGDWETSIQQEYRRARRELQGDREDLRGLGFQEGALQQRLREKILARRVARLAKQWLRVVHVGGWEHLRRSLRGQTMADFLWGLKPVMVLLDEAPA